MRAQHISKLSGSKRHLCTESRRKGTDVTSDKHDYRMQLFDFARRCAIVRQ
jgi:hypothetical protein